MPDRKLKKSLKLYLGQDLVNYSILLQLLTNDLKLELSKRLEILFEKIGHEIRFKL